MEKNEKMNAPQLNAFVKKQAVAALSDNLDTAHAVQTGDFSFDLPIEVDGATYYVRVDFTARNMKGTTRTAPFDLERTIEEWQTEKARKLADAEKKAADKAAEKAAAEAKKASKAKEN